MSPLKQQTKSQIFHGLGQFFKKFLTFNVWNRFSKLLNNFPKYGRFTLSSFNLYLIKRMPLLQSVPRIVSSFLGNNKLINLSC